MPGVRELHHIRSTLADLHSTLTRIEAIRLLDFDLRAHPRYGDPRRLLCYAGQVCSQNGEDGIIHEIFRRVGATSRIFVEIGVGDEVENNTAFLLSQGWSGRWIDGDPAFLERIKSGPEFLRKQLSGLVSFVTRENAAALLAQLNVPAEFDLLSVDIDQNTYYIWEALSGFRPRVVVVEYNSSIPSDIDWKVSYAPDRVWDGSQNFGAGLKALEILGRQLGYSLVGCEFCGVNAFFVRNDLVGDKFAEPFTSENHHEPPRYGCHPRLGHRNALLDGQ